MIKYMSLTLSNRLSIKRFTRGEPGQHSSLELNHRRIFILPNKSGLSLAMLIVLMLVASINYSNSMGFIFTFFLAAAAQTSTFYSFRNISKISVNATRNEPCFLGQPTSVSYLIKELEGRSRWAIIAKLGDCSVLIPQLQPYENYSLTLTVKPNARGIYTPSTLTLSTTFPFGIFRAWSPLLFNQKVLVYPKPLSFNTPLPVSHIKNNESPSSGIEKGTEEFAGFKPYQAGDHFRRVNWKAWGAGKGLHTNQFSAQTFTEIWLDWQACSATDTESRLSELCEWVLEAEKQGANYGLKLPHQAVAPSNGLQHQQFCLKLLALYQKTDARK
jgi:uncharacterized protein (DUF58 family)